MHPIHALTVPSLVFVNGPRRVESGSARLTDNIPQTVFIHSEAYIRLREEIKIPSDWELSVETN